ncbi:MAG: hypothetical protein IT431_03715 [Phycisphaerales bacterium]|nr:hypothetical protein [Phycisphaerales bacterium]
MTRRNAARRRLVIGGCAGTALAALVIACAGLVFLYRYDPLGMLFGNGLVLRDTPRAYAESRARADGIVEALGRYHAAKGRYPGSLEELTPQFLDVLRPPLVGKGRWTYSAGPDGGYYLEMFVGPDYESDFCTSTSSWYRDR